ncbi:hypothetical protein K431DRAFT_345527 [Polychaeton citri CBS 116435]|uniref:Uncharacterized protein n=1 Tax=Polychaeton citri CBS 116435 TaxID=1314669 RepID=A0A9P4Q9Y9_9PEZI|nr:hypothetical protein K431DRAFT_345527 [Polychaeton citri CBS 116435]
MPNMILFVLLIFVVGFSRSASAIYHQVNAEQIALASANNDDNHKDFIESTEITQTNLHAPFQTVVKGPPVARPARIRTTVRITSTRTTFTTWTSVTPTAAVQTWYGGQKKKEGCDRKACASCRWWYNCVGGEPECFNCDSSPYCDACPPPTGQEKPEVKARWVLS